MAEPEEKTSTLNIRVSKTSIVLLVGTAFVAALQYVASSWLRNPVVELDDHGSRLESLEKKIDRVNIDVINEELEELRQELDDAQYDIITCQRNMKRLSADISLHITESQKRFQSLDKQYTILDFQIGQCIKKVE